MLNWIKNALNKLIRRKFDRVPHFDTRSLDYPIGISTPTNKPRISKIWDCYAYLNQGTEGSCTGHAVAHELASKPISIPNMTHEIAVQIYKRAQKLDPWAGEDYEGSTVLAAVKAAKERGWYDEYRWAFGEEDLAMTVCYIGPVVLGINWYYGMSNPKNGVIKPTGTQVGGHAICCIGYDADRDMYILRNSWGKRWGDGGNCYIHKDDMKMLLKQGGEACVPIQRKY